MQKGLKEKIVLRSPLPSDIFKNIIDLEKLTQGDQQCRPSRVLCHTIGRSVSFLKSEGKFDRVKFLYTFISSCVLSFFFIRY